MKWQGKLEESLRRLQFLTTFANYSATNCHRYDLFRLMPRAGAMPGQGESSVPPIEERTPLLTSNPHFAD